MTKNTVRNNLFLEKHKLLKLIKRIKPFLNAKQSRLIKRLLPYLGKNKSTNVKITKFADKLFRLGLSSYKFEVSWYFDLVKQISHEKFIVKLMKQHYRQLSKKISTKKVKKTLPAPCEVNETIKKLYLKGKKKLALLLILMFITGRRSIDLLRLKVTDVSKINKNLYSASIPHDKKHNFQRNFKIDLKHWDDDWCFLSKKVFLREFGKLLDSGRVFEGVCKASLARDVAGIKPHILRSVRSIILIKKGYSDQRVLDYIGWDDLKSLKRYTKVSREVIVNLNWKKIQNNFNQK